MKLELNLRLGRLYDTLTPPPTEVVMIMEENYRAIICGPAITAKLPNYVRVACLGGNDGE